MIQFLTVLGGLATQWIQGKQEEAKAKQEVKLRTIQATESWDELQAKNANTSWKDEWFTILLSIPLIMAFIPSLVPYVEAGFVVLDSMPEYYKAFLAAAVAASFGMKGLATWKGNSNGQG